MAVTKLRFRHRMCWRWSFLMEFDTEKAQRVLDRVMVTEDKKIREEEYRLEKEAERIQKLIEKKTRMAEIYDTIGRKIQNGDGFRRSAIEERESVKRLQREYFILTGDTYFPRVKGDMKGSLISVIRELYIIENEMAKECEKAAKVTKLPRLGGLYRDIAKEDKRHGLRLLAYMERLI
jgi:DNA gyrase/topoisomerase IV subunit A